MSKLSFPPASNEPDDEGSITRIIRKMQKGDDGGADELWQRFFVRLKYLVKDRLRSRLGAVSDEEDVALESLSELFRGLLDGKFPALKNRDSFWRLLVTVSTRNVIDEINRENRLKRGAGKVIHASSLSSDGDNVLLFDRIASEADSPEVKMMIAERCTQLLESLPDKELQAIVIMRTTGSTNREIADSLGMSLRSVERRLNEIRRYWSDRVA